MTFFNTYPAMQKPRSLRAIIEEGLDKYAGVFVPGGHAPVTDLVQDPDLGVILRRFHDRSWPTALLCHGPIAVIAQCRRQWSSAARWKQTTSKAPGRRLGAGSIPATR